ncbi:HEAT repeat domain-containing protein [Kitasatospora sp. NPDC101155]|uniref:HEAT repeat domain-containing protein n=1 Tax=Kitasatospora sp. NPDC101155 TaxID=3364097 RepID=UPI003804C0FE
MDTIDWSSLRHAYGSAGDVPGWILDLYSSDPDQAHKTMDEFFGEALHQGSLSSAAVTAVPFLAHAAVHGVHKRASVLAALAGTGDPQVRRNTVRVARRATGETLPTALRELTACFESDPSAAVRSEALTVLTRLDPDARAVEPRLRSALADPVPAVRAAAAVGLVERAKAPYPAEVVAVLAEAGGDPELSVNSGEFAPGIGTVDSRLWELAGDADALTAVARGWIARGDHQIRGSRRAQRLSEVWRDRENETIGLLTAALAHDHAPWDLFTLLDAIARWLPGASHPDPALGDRLLPHARTNGQAQELLGHLGDQRLLTDIPDPRPRALAALAARTQRPEHQRLALRHPDGHGLDELYPALSPEAARTHLPDLIHLLHRHPTPTLLHRFGDWAMHRAPRHPGGHRADDRRRRHPRRRCGRDRGPPRRRPAPGPAPAGTAALRHRTTSGGGRPAGRGGRTTAAADRAPPRQRQHPVPTARRPGPREHHRRPVRRGPS